MRVAYLFFAVLAVVPRIADASDCPANELFVTSAQQLPLGCPLIAYGHQRSGSAAQIVVGGADGPLSLPTEYREVALSVTETRFNETKCLYEQTVVDYGYERVEFDTSSLAVGDMIVASDFAGSSGGIRIVTAGECPAEVIPQLRCTPEDSGDPDSCTVEDYNGCSVASPSLALGLLVLALRRRK